LEDDVSKFASHNSKITEEDREFYRRELASFVPDKVFDAHAHLWKEEFARWPIESDFRTIGYSEYRMSMDDLHPGREVAALFLPVFEDKTLIQEGNAWVSEQVKNDSRCRGSFFVKPTDDPEWVCDEVRRLKLHGLKCYHTMASTSPTLEAEIPDYLPEPLVKMADREGWVITLHMVKSRAVADPGNVYWIRRYCEKYPKMKLILAHSARGFQPGHNLEGLPKLADLANVYFDTSANCEAIAHEAIIRICGHQKLMYGSDLPVSHMRGRSIVSGDSFIWIYKDSPIWTEHHRGIRPTLEGLEHLRSLKFACWSERLSDQQVEDIFWNNAANLFGL
jgi:predicted TIM-barrel fold metal-dependent hydrolase